MMSTRETIWPSPQDIRRFSIKEYHWMAEQGILPPDERVELIDGIIRVMSPKGSRHTACVRKLTNLLPLLLRDRALVSVQDPVVLNDDTEPEPDVALVKPREDAYATGHPGPDDVLLIVEVADTSLDVDRTIKLPRYAEAGIPEVWIVNLLDRKIEVYQEPVEQPEGTGAYRVRRDYFAGDTLAPWAFPSIQIAVNDILA